MNMVYETELFMLACETSSQILEQNWRSLLRAYKRNEAQFKGRKKWVGRR